MGVIERPRHFIYLSTSWNGFAAEVVLDLTPARHNRPVLQVLQALLQVGGLGLDLLVDEVLDLGVVGHERVLKQLFICFVSTDSSSSLFFRRVLHHALGHELTLQAVESRHNEAERGGVLASDGALGKQLVQHADGGLGKVRLLCRLQRLVVRQRKCLRLVSEIRLGNG